MIKSKNDSGLQPQPEIGDLYKLENGCAVEVTKLGISFFEGVTLYGEPVMYFYTHKQVIFNEGYDIMKKLDKDLDAEYYL